MKTIDDININTWFVDRELSVVPEHFTKTTTPITSESKTWILEKLRGRFAIIGGTLGMFGDITPSFEDPKEAVFYELTWG